MSKIKIGLYLTNSMYGDLDLSKPYLGNPGIGGTQYMFLCLPHYYNLYFNDVEFIFFAHKITTLSNKYKKFQVNSLIEAANMAKQKGCDIFIYRPTIDNEAKEFLSLIKNIKLKTIAWAHNTPFKLLDELSNNEYIVRYINVSQEQYDMLRDHSIIYKSTVIYNGFDSNITKNYISCKKKKYVTYVGSLIPAKGFHILAYIWKDILKEVPDAKLKVIGSGKLYNRNAKLGKWQIADEAYEKQWRKFLSDDFGNKLESVDFLGVLGREKFNIMAESLIGVPNPTGISENCPGSAIEFQAVGTCVVSGAYWGLLDTVNNGKTGYLVKTREELKEKIIYLLKNEDKALEMGQNGIKFVEDKFNWEKISKQWNKEFFNILNEKKVDILPLTQNFDFEYKLFSEKMRNLKEKYPILRVIPPYIKIRPYHRKVLKLFGIKKWEMS